MVQKHRKARFGYCAAVFLIAAVLFPMIIIVTNGAIKSVSTGNATEGATVKPMTNGDASDFDWYVPADALTAESDGNGGAVLTGIAKDAMKKRFDERDFFREFVDITLNIPSEIAVDGETLPVTEIAANAFNIPNWPVTTPLGGENYSYIFRIIKADFSEAINLVKIGERAFFRNKILVLDLIGAVKLAEIGYNALTWHHEDGDDDYLGDGGYGSPQIIYAGEIAEIGNLFTLGLDTELFIAADESARDHYYNDCLAAEGYKWLSHDEEPVKGLEHSEIWHCLTYEVTVQFLHNDGSEAAPAETKLHNLPFSYVKTEYLNNENYWRDDPDYSFPVVERPRNTMPPQWCYKMSFGMGGAFYRNVYESGKPSGNDILYWHGEEFFSVRLEDNGENSMPDVYTSFDADRLRTVLGESKEFVVSAELHDYEVSYYQEVDFYTLTIEDGRLTEGENTVTVTLDDFETSFTVNAVLWELTGFTIGAPPQRLSYTAYQTLDTEGLSLLGEYNDGQNLPLTDCTVIYQHGDCFLAGDTKVYIDIPAGEAAIRKELDVSVAKATYDLAALGVTFQDTELRYDRKPKSLKITGQLPEGVTVFYDISGVTQPGAYQVTAVFTVTDEANYNPIPSMTATLTVVKVPLSSGAVAGIVLGGTALLAAAAAVIFILRQKRLVLAAEQATAGKEDALSPEELEAVRGLLQGSRNGHTPLPDTLTRTELEVVGALFEGLSRKQIAGRLFISNSTVNFHIKNIFGKCGCASVNELLIKYKGN